MTQPEHQQQQQNLLDLFQVYKSAYKDLKIKPSLFSKLITNQQFVIIPFNDLSLSLVKINQNLKIFIAIKLVHLPWNLYIIISINRLKFAFKWLSNTNLTFRRKKSIYTYSS